MSETPASGAGYRINALSDLYCLPVVYGLQQPESPAAAGLSFDSAGINTERLLAGECDAALIGAVEYARNSSDFSLLPSIGVSSRGESRTILLCLNRDIRKITTVATGVVSSSEIVLTKLILSEKYEQGVAFVPVIGSLEQMLSKADAALLTGDAALRSGWRGPLLDLVDEWSDMTDLPFVHACCAVRTEKTGGQLSSLLLSSQDAGIRSFRKIASDRCRLFSLSPDHLEQQLELYSYGFDEEAREGLGEFYRYAFYLGLLPDVPEINLIS